MSLASLLTEDGNVLPYSESGTDDYNNPVGEFGDPVAVKCRLEQTEALEVTTDRGTRISRHRLFLHPTVTIGALDRFTYDGDTYELVGPPTVQRTPRGPHHIEARLELVAGG